MRPALALLPLLALPVLAAHLIGLASPGSEGGLETRERAMALVNAGQQISAAQAIYRLHGGDSATEMKQLVDRGDLLIPAPGSPDDTARLGSWKTDGRYAYVSLDGDVSSLCAELSRQASGSRSGAATGVGPGGDQFGCVQGGGQSRFVFRTR